MTTPIMTPKVMAEIRRINAERTLRVLRGGPWFTRDEIRQSLREPIPGPLHRGGSRTHPEDR